MHSQRPVVIVAMACLGLWLPELAWADNCGSFSDCFSSLRAALAALVGVGTFAALLSLALDFLPIIGTWKGILEAFTGRDLVTGEKLPDWARWLGILPGLGVLGDLIDGGGAAARAGRALDSLHDLSRAGRGADHLGDAAGGLAGAGRAADAVRGAGRADDAADAVRGAGRADDAADAGRGGRADDAADAGRGGRADDAADAGRGGRADDAAEPQAQPELPPRQSPRKPATLGESMTKLRPAEQRTAKRLADGNPAFDGRTFEAPPSDRGYDWVDDLGRKYDAMGDGTKSKYFNLDQFTDSIDHHLLKGNDFTVIDMTGYTPEQIAAVQKYVNGLPAAKQASIIKVGF
jgi:hypothetical protein